MNREIKFRGKRYNGNWTYGFYRDVTVEGKTYCYIFWQGYEHNIIPESAGQFTGKKLSKGDEVYEGTIAFTEHEEEEGDVRIYIVCVWIKEWSMFGWLNTGEYLNYQDNGAEALDETMFWTYTIENSEAYHHAGNIIDNPELLNK